MRSGSRIVTEAVLWECLNALAGTTMPGTAAEGHRRTPTSASNLLYSILHSAALLSICTSVPERRR
jgi:hypothetical protein